MKNNFIPEKIRVSYLIESTDLSVPCWAIIKDAKSSRVVGEFNLEVYSKKNNLSYKSESYDNKIEFVGLDELNIFNGYYHPSSVIKSIYKSFHPVEYVRVRVQGCDRILKIAIDVVAFREIVSALKNGTSELVFGKREQAYYYGLLDPTSKEFEALALKNKTCSDEYKKEFLSKLSVGDVISTIKGSKHEKYLYLGSGYYFDSFLKGKLKKSIKDVKPKACHLMIDVNGLSKLDLINMIKNPSVGDAVNISFYSDLPDFLLSIEEKEIVSEQDVLELKNKLYSMEYIEYVKIIELVFKFDKREDFCKLNIPSKFWKSYSAPGYLAEYEKKSLWDNIRNIRNIREDSDIPSLLAGWCGHIRYDQAKVLKLYSFSKTKKKLGESLPECFESFSVEK